MIRYLLVFVVLLSGCKAELTPPPAYRYTPMLSVLSAVIVMEQGDTPTPDVPDAPDVLVDYRDCVECDGKGWTGDGQPRSDCLNCTHPKWDDYFGSYGDQPTNAEVLDTYVKYEAEISEIWLSLPDSGTMREAVRVWQQQQDAKQEKPPEPESAAEETPPTEIQWLPMKDLASLRSQARASGKPLYLHITGPNCRGCEKQARYVFTDPVIIRLINQNFTPVWVEWLESGHLLDSLEIEIEWPQEIVEPLNGVPRFRVYGLELPVDFDKQMRQIAAASQPKE